MDESNSAAEVKEAESPPRRLTPPKEVNHRPHGGTGLSPAVACGAHPVLRTTATTEVMEDPSDGGDRVEPSFPNASEICFGNNDAQCGARAGDVDREENTDVGPDVGRSTHERGRSFDRYGTGLPTLTHSLQERGNRCAPGMFD